MVKFRFFLAGCVLQLAACGSGDSGAGDAGLSADAADEITIDASTTPDASTEPDATISLAAPVLTAPIADDAISSAVQVTGSGVADATIDIAVVDGTTTIGTATGTADASGDFSIAVTYVEPAGGTVLSIEVLQSDDSGSSPTASVAVAQDLVALAITEPLAAASVADPVRVVGSADPGATIDISVLDGATVLGGTSVVATAGGAFNLLVPYTNAAADTALTIRTLQSSGALVSSPVDVAVVQSSVQVLSGTVSQASGNNGGTSVYVRLYDQDDEVLDFVDELEFTATDGIDLASTAYSFEVPNGNYFVRAFRDSAGPSGTPDGHPSLPQDAQTPPLAVNISDAPSTGNAVSLVNTGAGDNYQGFNVFALNESFEATPPFFNDVNGNGVPGTGLCGGFHMRAEVQRNGGNLTPPLIRLPNGSDVTMLDNGACGQNVHDNSSSSYDRNENDSQFTMGIPDPGAADAGDYVFGYAQTTGGQFIHSQVDRVETVIKLDRGARVTSPTGAAANTDLTPTIIWTPVTGADGYFVEVRGVAGYSERDNSATNNFTVSAGNPLIDDRPYQTQVFPLVHDLIDANDIDAAAGGVASFFITDLDGNTSTTLSGNIEDLTGLAGDFLVFGRGSNAFNELQFEASVVLADSATSYSLVVLKDQNPGCPSLDSDSAAAEVLVTIDANGSGDLNNSRRDAIAQSNQLNGCADLGGVDLRFTPGIELLAPLAGTTGVGNTPSFSWVDYAVTFNAAAGSPITNHVSAYSYALFAQNQASNNDFPDLIWGLPPSATSLNMSNLPVARFDVLELASGGASSNPLDLSAGTNWSWGLVVVECDFSQLNTGLGTDPYRECLGVVLGQDNGFFAFGGELPFTP